MLKNCLHFTVLRLENKSGRKKNSKSGTVGTLKNEVNINLVRRVEYRNDLSFSINFFCSLLNDFFFQLPFLQSSSGKQKIKKTGKNITTELGGLSIGIVLPVFPIT